VDSGVFKKLQSSKKYILPYVLEERARKEGKEEGLKEKTIDMARTMKQKGSA